MDLDRLSRRAAGGDVTAARRLLAALEERTSGPPRTVKAAAREAARQVVLRASPDQRAEWIRRIAEWTATDSATDDDLEPVRRILQWESRHAARTALASFSGPISDVLMQGMDEESVESFRRALEGDLDSDVNSLHILERHIAIMAREILARDAESLAAEDE